MVAGESQEAGHFHPVAASPMFHTSRGTHLYTHKNFFFFIFDFLNPPIGGEKRRKFFCVGCLGGFRISQGAMFHVFPLQERDAEVGEIHHCNETMGARGKTRPIKRFPVFFVKGGCVCVSEAWGASKKRPPPPQRLERDRLQPLTATRSCNSRERKNIYSELRFLQEILYLCSA